MNPQSLDNTDGYALYQKIRPFILNDIQQQMTQQTMVTQSLVGQVKQKIELSDQQTINNFMNKEQTKAYVNEAIADVKQDITNSFDALNETMSEELARLSEIGNNSTFQLEPWHKQMILQDVPDGGTTVIEFTESVLSRADADKVVVDNVAIEKQNILCMPDKRYKVVIEGQLYQNGARIKFLLVYKQNEMHQWDIDEVKNLPLKNN